MDPQLVKAGEMDPQLVKAGKMDPQFRALEPPHPYSMS